MAEPYTPAELEAIAQQAQQRIAAALADLREVNPRDGGGWGTHFTDCWHLHAGCLARRMERTLTGEDHPQ